MNSFWFVLTFCAAIGSALIGGVFFAFSTFVMRALARLPAAQGIAAMQSINIVVINPVFMLGFLGTGAASFVLLIRSIMRWNEPGAPWLLGGSLLYLLGTLGVTMVFNVPRNNALARVKSESAEEEIVWRKYLVEWTRWNHVRTLAALGAAAVFVLALMRNAG